MKSEFEFIEDLKNRLSAMRGTQNVSRFGIGDDCAVLPKDAKTDLVITTDLLVEDIDFRLDWTRAEFLGHKALAVSLSDVAAMGAKPVWAMLSIGIPTRIWKTDFVEKFYDGWLRLAKRFEVELIGGDVSKTPDKIVIDSIAAGETRRGKAVLRSGAKAGDLIFATGEIGGAAAGLRLLEGGERFGKSKFKKLLLRQIAPNPQTKIGQILGAKNLPTAMIDLSDGISSDLSRLCKESGAGAKIFADKIPVDENLKDFLTQGHKNSKTRKTNKGVSEELDFALNGGEDFELLFTVNPKKKFQMEKELENFPFSRIGEITSNTGKIELIRHTEATILQPRGFRHF